MRLSVDSRQRAKGAATFMLEFYKIICGTFLTVFVPHSCGDRICSFSHNLYENVDDAHRVAVFANTVCFLAFLRMYTVEIRRENWCITYLDVDPQKSNENLDTEIERYPDYKRRMGQLNRSYKEAVRTCCFAHAINLLVSLIDVVQSWPGAAAFAPLLSYVILVTAKLFASAGIAKSSLQRERAYSAYLSGPKTFNAIDADYVVKGDIEVEIEG